MDKGKLLDKAAANADERLLLARVLDKYEQCQSRSIPTHTGFLSAAEQQAASQLLQAAGVVDGFAFRGGYEGAERQVLFFLPEWQEEPEIDDTICHISAKFYESDSISHRDILGSLMGMGIVRETVGDILVESQSAHVLVLAEMADFLLQNWEGAGRTHLTLTRESLTALQPPAPQVREIRDTVASLRLDAVVASGFSLSRGRAAELIAAGRVQLNHRDCDKSDRPVAQGDVISARGLGKFEVAQAGGRTKKGRTPILLRRYL